MLSCYGKNLKGSRLVILSGFFCPKIKLRFCKNYSTFGINTIVSNRTAYAITMTQAQTHFQSDEIDDIIQLNIIPDRNNITIYIPVKTHKSINHIKHGLVDNILAEHDQADRRVAKELCLYILSFLRITNTTKLKQNKYRPLKYDTLNYILRPLSIKSVSDNTVLYNYKKNVFAALTEGTLQQGPFIKCDNEFEHGVSSLGYLLTDTYKKGFRPYVIQSKYVADLIYRNVYEMVKKLTNNPIAMNMFKFYDTIVLPTTEELLSVGKVLTKNKFITNSGKQLTMRNRHLDQYWEDVDTRSFVEDNIESYESLITPSMLIPKVGSVASGFRLYDSITSMPSWIRSEIKDKKGNKLISLDFTCLHPNIAASLYGGKEKYLTHDKVAKYIGKDRVSVKTSFLSFFNSTAYQMENMHKDLWIYYTKNEPDMLDRLFDARMSDCRDENGELIYIVDKKGKLVKKPAHKCTSQEMMKKEVKIMSDIIQQLNAQGIYVGYVFDALICSPDHADIVEKIMNETILAHGVYTKVKRDNKNMNYTKEQYDEAGDLLALIPDNKLDAQKLLQTPSINAQASVVASQAPLEYDDSGDAPNPLKSSVNDLAEFEEYLDKPKNDLESTLDDLLDFSDLTEKDNLTVVKQEVTLPVQQENKTSEVKTDDNKNQIYNILKNAKDYKANYTIDQYSKDKHNEMVRIKSNLNMISFKLKQFPKLQPMYNELVRWFTVECKRLNSIETINNRKLKCISY